MPGLFVVVGALGAIAFAGVNLPQVIKCRRQRNTGMISMLTVWLNILGNIFSCSYVLYTDITSGVWHYPLYFNYGTALAVAIWLYLLKKRYG